MSNLDRFKEAQTAEFEGFATAISELRRGRKTSHWIWYVFPQLAGLGRSDTSQLYGIRDVGEAREYLRDSLLRGRLLEAARAVEAHTRPGPVNLSILMGSELDAMKLVSSLTLFRRVAENMNRVEPSSELAALASIAACILESAARQGYPECQQTMARLDGTPR